MSAVHDYEAAIRQAAAQFEDACGSGPARDGAAPVPAGQEQRKFAHLSAQEILALSSAPARVKGILPAEGVAAIYGPSGSAKTFVTLDLAFAVAGGTRWFGLRTSPCAVLYVNLESSSGLRKRLAAWQKEMGRPVPDAVRFVVEPFSLLEDAEALACGVERGAMVVIDTLNASAAGLDENSSRDMGLIFDAAKRLQRITGGLVLLIHHSGKDSARGLRGHSSLLAALDAALEVGRNGDVRFWRISKAKEDVDGVRREFRLKAIPLGRDPDGEIESSCVVVPCEGAARQERKPLTDGQLYTLESLRRALEQAGSSSVHLEQWRPVFYAKHSAATADGKLKAFNRGRTDLVNLGVISVENDFYSLAHKPDTDKSRT